MNDDHDASYYLRREESARDLARKSGNPSVIRIHTEMADRYAELANRALTPRAPNTLGQ